MFKATPLLCASIVCALLAGGLVSTAPADQAQRDAMLKTMKDGNYNDAYEGFRKLALDPDDEPRKVGEDLNNATNCLQRLNRVAEIDAFREAVIDVHQGNWRLLRAAAPDAWSTPPNATAFGRCSFCSRHCPWPSKTTTTPRWATTCWHSPGSC